MKEFKLYCCIGCNLIHYDDDYDKEDGDILIRDWKEFLESIEVVKHQLKNERGKA